MNVDKMIFFKEINKLLDSLSLLNVMLYSMHDKSDKKALKNWLEITLHIVNDLMKALNDNSSKGIMTKNNNEKFNKIIDEKNMRN